MADGIVNSLLYRFTHDPVEVLGERGRDAARPRSFTSGDAAQPRLFMPRAPSAADFKAAAAVILCLLLLAAGLTPFATMMLRPVPGFVVAYSTAQIILNLLIGVLLLCKARIENDHNHLNLASAYLFCGLIVVFHLLTFPDALVPGMILGIPGTTTWMWLFWHGGFPLLIISCCLRARQRRRTAPRATEAVAPALLLVLLLSYLAIYHVRDLPVILQGGHYFPGRAGAVIKLVLLSIDVLACLLVPLTFRLRTAQSLWLTVSMVGTCVDVWLTTHGGQRYSTGWYFGRLGGISSVSIIFILLLNDVLLTYSKVATANDVLDRLTLTDALTELGNRRLFDQTLELEWRRCRRQAVPLAVVMIDVDAFKSFNDAYGHQAGDECLRQIAGRLSAAVSRPGDMAIRYGGEEFALILPATDSQGAAHLAQRIRLGVRDLVIPHAGSARGTVTISAGVASLIPSEAFEATELVKLADIALYRAKESGRDTLRIAGAETPDGGADPASAIDLRERAGENAQLRPS